MSAKDPGVTAFLGRCSTMLRRVAKQLGKELKASALKEAFPNGNHITFAEHELDGCVWTLNRRPAGQLQQLTRLESKIYLCVKAGLSNKETAKAIDRKESTVAAYLRRMHKKLCVHSRTALAECSVSLTSTRPRGVVQMNELQLGSCRCMQVSFRGSSF